MQQKSYLYYPKNLGDAPEYIFGGVSKNSDLIFVPEFTSQPKSLIRKILKFLLVGRVPLRGRLVEWITGYKGYAWLPTLKPGDRLLIDGVTNLHTLEAVAWLTSPSVTRYLYFNNCLKFIYPKHLVGKKIRRMQAMGYHVVTFDPQEAKDYGMQYAEQFYRFPLKTNTDIKYDFFFCGEKKDRSLRLADLEGALRNMGYRCLFIVVDSEEKRISYRQYLNYLLQSRCIVDLQQEGQIGITRRPVEALFFNKKLLTENSFISSYDFFRKQNILIIEKGNLNAKVIRDFINGCPMVPVPREILQKYEVNHWLGYFK